MKKLSRYLALLLIVLMLASMTVSCKKKTDEDDGAAVDSELGDDASPAEGDTGTGSTGDTGGTSGNSGGSNSTGKSGGTVSKTPGSGSKGGGTLTKKDGYTVNEKGEIVDTKTNSKYDGDFHYTETITNDNGFIPDEEQGLEKSERRATEASKYDFDKNPLINRDRQQNKEIMPSFPINDTGFVTAGTKTTDLKGKTLAFFTSDNFAAWSYRNEKGVTITEWDWFKQLKTELGLTVKFTKSQHQKAIDSTLQYMNAGKQCDVIYSSHVTFPSSICISKSITSVVSINNLGSSPGVCKKTMDICKWGNTLRLISPIGVVDVIWYNQTLAQELNLSDPHLMWEHGQWNWDTFKKFMLSAPKTTKGGEKLVAFVQWPSNASYIWPSTNGSPRICIDANNPKPALINNWDNDKTLAAWEFITGVCNSVNYGCSTEGANGVQPEHMGMYQGTTLMSATMYTQVYRDTEYSKKVQINWVPYPMSTTGTGQQIGQYYGFGMMLPRKSAKPELENVALKFMELWATRFTETLFDNLYTFEYYSFNYKQRKQYFDFVTNNVVFALAMNDFVGSSLGTDTNFFKCFTGDSAYNVKTEAIKGSNIVKKYIDESIAFGQ